MVVNSISIEIFRRLIEADQYGIIHSKYDRSVNIELPNETSLITLVLPEVGRLPYAIVLSNDFGNDFTLLPWENGDEIILSLSEGVFVPQKKPIFKFINYSLWSPIIKYLPGKNNGINVHLLENVSWAFNYIYKYALSVGLSSELFFLLYEKLEPYGFDLFIPTIHQQSLINENEGFEILYKALISNDFELVQNQVGSLIGLGIGLTPSADDVLTGMLATFNFVAIEDGRYHLKDLLDGALQNNLNLNRTTRVSYTQLMYALKGQFSEKINLLMNALQGEHNTVLLSNQLNWMVSLGASSGVETTLGIILGFDIYYRCSQQVKRGEEIDHDKS